MTVTKTEIASVTPLPRKVISGGQTGADQAGLVAARRFGIPTGGWMPRGWKTSGDKLAKWSGGVASFYMYDERVGFSVGLNAGRPVPTLASSSLVRGVEEFCVRIVHLECPACDSDSTQEASSPQGKGYADQGQAVGCFAV